MKTTRLPADLSRLAAVLAHRQAQKAAWIAAEALRRNLADRIEAGESPDALLGEMTAAAAQAGR